MSKITLPRTQAIKIMRFYAEYLIDKFKFQPLTPAMLEIIKSDLLYKQKEMAITNNNLIWKLPLIVFSDDFNLKLDIDAELIDLNDPINISFVDG